MGNYCLITGSSEGFGKALAWECASRKMNLILVALPGPELYSVADLIKTKFKVDVITIEKDLAVEENCMSVFRQVKELGVPVNMLINNAGVGNNMLFTEGSIAFYQKQIKLNVLATTMLTHLFLNQLKPNTAAYVLNVGSLNSYFYLPKKQVYGATKSYIYSFSKCLRRELGKGKINVSVICPGHMHTNAAIIELMKTANWLSRRSVMEPEAVAAIAINGLFNKKEVIIPGKINKLFLLLNMLVPSAIKTMIISSQMKKMKSVIE